VKGSNNQNADMLNRIRPCKQCENNEPCTQCQRRITGDHSVSADTTRRQARREYDMMNQNGASPPTAAHTAVNPQLAAPEASFVATDLASKTADVSVNNCPDNSNQRPKTCPKKSRIKMC